MSVDVPDSKVRVIGIIVIRIPARDIFRWQVDVAEVVSCICHTDLDVGGRFDLVTWIGLDERRV